MAIRRNAVLRDISLLFDLGKVADLTDGQLLERYATRDGKASELAFAALVERHGPMVLRVCRAVLRDPHDAQDAFQATFLVLIRKAGSLWIRESLSPWLHGVAYRVATHARSDSARRRWRERRAAEMTPQEADEGARHDLEAALHEEVGRLPERYRDAVVLCDLNDLTHEQAARHLGCPVGTIKSRLARGRERLRGHLARRGIAPAVGIAKVFSSPEVASAVVPSPLLDSTTRAAMRFTAGKMAVGAASASVIAISGGVLKTMWLARLKASVGAALMLTTIVIGAGALAQHGDGRRAPRATTPSRMRHEDRIGKNGKPTVAHSLLSTAPPPAQVEGEDGEGTKEELIDGLLARSTAIKSGRIEYHLKVEIAWRTERDSDYRFSFSGEDWSIRSPDLNQATINRDGRLLVYVETPPRDGTVHRSLTIRSPESPFKNSPGPPVLAGTLENSSTRRFVRERASKARTLGAETVNGVETQVLEWDVAARDAYFAFGSIPDILRHGGKLRLFVAPQLGYALPRVEHVDKFGTVQERFECSDFEEVAPKVFFPKKYRLGVFFPKKYRLGPGTYTKACDVTKVDKVNEPIPIDDFVLSIPAGTSISDERSKSTDKVDPDGGHTFSLEDYPFRQFRAGAPYPRGFPAELLKELDRDVVKSEAHEMPWLDESLVLQPVP